MIRQRLHKQHQQPASRYACMRLAQHHNNVLSTCISTQDTPPPLVQWGHGVSLDSNDVNLDSSAGGNMIEILLQQFPPPVQVGTWCKGSRSSSSDSASSAGGDGVQSKGSSQATARLARR
eukprot:1158421-Pelagomonas_calceolata.AAC.4